MIAHHSVAEWRRTRIDSAGIFARREAAISVWRGHPVYDTTDFKQVDKWELSRPIQDGLGRIDLGFDEDINEEPGFYTGIFNVQDAVVTAASWESRA